MQDFIRTHGKALDISGAFAFSALFLGCLSFGYNLFALACAFSALAFFQSWRFWSAPDYSEEQFNRTMCALFSLIAAVLFVVAIVVEVLA